jgi:ABC-2 type transport system permease protein
VTIPADARSFAEAASTHAEAPPVPAAPLLRLLASETRWVLRRPRTLVVLAVFALMPVLIAVGVVAARGRAGGLIGNIVGNGLVLPVVSIILALALLLPLAVSMAAADAIAGESAAGTLRGLLLAPVSRLRLMVTKAYGVLVVATLAVLVIAIMGVLSALVVVGGAGEMVTLSGTSVSFGAGLGRVALVVVWAVGQLAAIGAVALAVSTFTDHPLVVLASVLGTIIVFGVLTAIPALDWLQPWLLTSGWAAGADVLRDPLPLGGLIESSVRALCYAGVGGGIAVARMLRRDA